MTEETAVALLWIAAGALFAPAVARRLALPTAVAEIVFGILIGRGGLGLVAETEIVSFLAHVGFLFLMFIAGLEIDFDALEASGGTRRRAATAVVLLYAVCGGVVAAAGLSAVMLLVLGAVSIGIAVPVLRESGLMKKTQGQAILIFGTVGEVATLVALTVYETWVKYGVSSSLLVGLARLGLVIGVAALALRTISVLAWWRPERFAGVADRNDPQEFGVRLALALMFALVAAAVLLGVEGIVGAFLAGATLLGAPFTLLVAVAEVGYELGRLDDARASSVVLAAILSAVVCPWAFRTLVRLKEAASAEAPHASRPPLPRPARMRRLPLLRRFGR